MKRSVAKMDGVKSIIRFSRCFLPLVFVNAGTILDVWAATGQSFSSATDDRGVHDDADALAALDAHANGARIRLERRPYHISKSLSLSSDYVFPRDAVFLVGSGATVTLGGQVFAEDNVYIFRGSGIVKVVRAARTSVDWWGAGVNADAAPAFRQALGSDREVVVPPGHYTFSSTVAAPYKKYFDPVGVLVQGYSHLRLAMYGAEIKAASAIGLSSLFHFDKLTDFAQRGGELVGDRSTLEPNQENVGETFTNIVGFDVRDLRIGAGFGGAGAGIGGDYLVNGTFANINMSGVGICGDFAFLSNIKFTGIHAWGADAQGRQGPAQTGSTCLSFIYDFVNGPNGQAINATGADVKDSHNVHVVNSSGYNFNTGVAVSSGAHFKFENNDWHDNPGLPRQNIPGRGYLFFYRDGGAFSSVGHPVQDVVISRDSLRNNGAAGVFIDAAAVRGADIMKGFNIQARSYAGSPVAVDGRGAASALADVKLGCAEDDSPPRSIVPAFERSHGCKKRP